GSYKWYKSVECRMAGVHDYAKYVKRGFGRGTDFASQDVRAGLLTREEAFDLAAEVDAERPETLDYYLKITGYSEEEFYKILKDKRAGKAVDLP
ncbi:MAG: N-acetyl sugar amidotransferase, partial [Rhodospirillaceae bacterium]|nr:N-acetyl sugar amidotransferase [Rhodospirillaceae bacterium]